jgi:hypothetical protein
MGLRLSFGEPARLQVCGGEVVAAAQGVRVPLAEHRRLVGERGLQQGEGVMGPAGVLVGVGQVAAVDKGVRVPLAEHSLVVGERLFVKGDGLIEPARRLVRVREVVAATLIACRGLLGAAWASV